VKQHEGKRDLHALVGESVGVAGGLAFEQAVDAHFARVVAWLAEPIIAMTVSEWNGAVLNSTQILFSPIFDHKLETTHGRDIVTLANEREGQQRTPNFDLTGRASSRPYHRHGASQIIQLGLNNETAACREI
jgi:hypothetical protein